VHLCWHHRTVPESAVPLYPVPAHDFDIRNAYHSAASRSRGGEGMKQPIYGLMAEFDDPTTLVAATRRTRQAGYRKMDAYSPFPIEELSEALGEHHDRLPLLVLLGGVAGGTAGFLFQYWASAIDYPINVGGRPLLSWPSFIPVTFEMTILVAALVAV